MNKKIILIITITVAIIGTALWVGNHFFRNPRTALLRAAAKTFDEIKTSPEQNFFHYYNQIKSAPWRQEISVNINKPGGSLLPGLDPRALSIMDMVTYKHTARYDDTNRYDYLAAQIAVTPLMEIEIESGAEEIAIRLPQAFEYLVAIDPRKIKQEWDTSVFGSYIGSLPGDFNEKAFYEYYLQFLFPEKDRFSINWMPDFLENIGILDENAEYKYEGNGVYSVAVTNKSLNEYWQAIDFFSDRTFPDDIFGAYAEEIIRDANGLRFNEDLKARVLIQKGKITELDFETEVNGQKINGKILFIGGEPALLDKVQLILNVDSTQVNALLLSDVTDPSVLFSDLRIDIARPSMGTAHLSWHINWNKKNTASDNFVFEISAGYLDLFEFQFNADGLLKTDNENRYIDAQIKSAGFNFDSPFGDLYALFNGRYMVRTDTEALNFTEERRLLSSLNEWDVLTMTAKLMMHPQLGDLFENFGLF
jgi:hypothetical protein